MIFVFEREAKNPNKHDITQTLTTPKKRFYLFSTQSRLLTTLRKKPFKNIVGKGENAGNQHFHLFPQCFLPFPKQMLSIWTSLRFCLFVNG